MDKIYSNPQSTAQHQASKDLSSENRKLKAELKRVTGARYSKKDRSVLCQKPKVKYAFIKEYEPFYPVRRMCKTLQVHFSGYYAWAKQPESKRDIANKVVLHHIKEAYEQSGRIYGYRTVTKDLVTSGILISKKRVARLTSEDQNVASQN
ncbi:IS3 family transposase [Wolinella succinogenes]|uniref:IS3 family transposase n=1 Tax=Wolinella succinogenes TaxID=844 RepID=UPI002357962B|nr:IS3 family transposase [Wolinella succinogenes]